LQGLRRHSRAVAVRAEKDKPSSFFPEAFVNAITVAVKNSPLNAGKLALAKAQAGQYDEAAVKAKIQNLIKDNPVVVFSWSGCPFCKKAKAVLDAAGARYTALELDELADGKALRAELAALTGRTSVPNIWIGGANVGGCNDGPGIATLQAKGELEPMLRAAGAL
jgi:glutaredoxin 3